MFGQLTQPLLAIHRQKDRRDQCNQRLIGTDVRGRLLPPNMLLTRGERQHITPLAIGVLGLANQTPRHLAHELFLARDDSTVRPAKAHRNAKRLRLQRYDVGLRRRSYNAQRNRLGDRHNQQRALGVSDLRNRRHILNRAEEVGRLNQYASRLAGDRRVQSGQIHATILLVANLGNGNLLMLRVGRNHLAILWMHRARDDSLVASGDAHGHHHGLSRAGRTVVHRRVGDLHAGEFADHRLELEHRLQRTLRDLRLVRRVAGQKLAALDERVDDDRPIVAIRPRAKKAGVARCIVVGEGAEAIDDLRLRVLARNRKIARQLKFGGNRRKQIVNGIDANLRKHLLAVVGRLGQIAH